MHLVPTQKVDEIEKQLNKYFETICDWFVNNKLSIHFGEDKTKLILSASKLRSKNVRQLNIRYNHINIKLHLQVTYLGCVLDETMSDFFFLVTLSRVGFFIRSLPYGSQFSSTWNLGSLYDTTTG